MSVVPRTIFFSLVVLAGILIIGVHPALAVDSGYESLAVDTGAGIISVRLIRINLKSEGLGVKSLTTYDGDCKDNCPVQSLGTFVQEVGGFAGINGSYFCPADYASCASQDGSYFWLWYDSVSGAFSNSYQNQFNRGPVIAFGKDNSTHFFRYAKDWPGKTEFESRTGVELAAVISNGPGLIFEGNLIVTDSDLDTKQRTVKSNRSAIAFKGDNVYLAVASSATVMDLGRALKVMGMYNAMNLDGGGSSALHYNGSYILGPGRNIPNALVFTSTGSTVSAAPQPRVASGTSFFAYDSTLRSGFTVSSGNVLGDSKDEIVTGTASGLAPHVRVYDGKGNLLKQFFAYDSGLRNGVNVTACNIDGVGSDEIVTAQGRGGWPLVRIFDGSGNLIRSGFYVLDGKFTGGVNLTCGDTNGDGTSEIVVGAMRGGGPQVMIYNEVGRALTNFMAYDPGFRGGIMVSTADADGDGKDEIITGPQTGAPHIQIFQVRNAIKRLSPGFYAFSTSYRGGVAVAGVDTNGDGKKEIVVGVGDNATPFVKVYNIREQWQDEFFAYATTFLGGLQLAGGDVDGDGKDELLTVPRGGGAPQVRMINL
ncbi:MAG: phosphodiester glycosidase family protein [Candidatus Kerfeldbacteria bacterium]|nr:phosphodiester glycosidase family protein [Candidatus Kerfeldbacteria bacterium]